MQVSEAAVIGIPDAKWGERPLLIVVPKKGEARRGGWLALPLGLSHFLCCCAAWVSYFVLESQSLLLLICCSPWGW